LSPNPAELNALGTEARRFLESECPIAVVRSAIGEQDGYPSALWKQMAGLGWLGVAVDEDHGGLGGGTAALCALAREAGRALAPGPFLFTAALAAPLLAAGSDNLLPYVLSGESFLAVASSGECVFEGKTASGEFDVVIDASGSEHILIVTQEEMAFVESDVSGLTISPIEWIDLSRRAARVSLDRARIAARLRVPDDERARIFPRARAAVAAE